jgi:hypothetical protein
MKPLFRLALALSLFAQTHIHAQEIPCAWSTVERIVAVGDVHADGDQLIACLRAGGVIDEQQKWIGGKTHLVQLGDLLDPGTDLKKVMDLLMALEVQAQEAGGRVHALLGNHELMILNDTHNDLGETEVASFGGLNEYRKAMRADGKYGKWLRSHNTVIKINDLLFVHGGLSSDYATLSLEAINTGVRDAMNHPASRNMAHDPQGPLWFRSLALEENPQKLGGMLAPILRGYGVKHVVIGHTITGTRKITAKAGGALIMTDVGMSDTYGRGSAMCLVIEKGNFFSVTPAKKQKLRVE